MPTENNLQRFIEAQNSDYEIALSEIKNGKKRSHWMWYIFPQVQGLGSTETSRFYAIRDIAQAQSYLEHPVLGKRIISISKELLQLKDDNPHNIFGSPDDLKLKSSMTLFALVKNADPVFQLVLKKFFKGAKDQRTIEILNK
jgi:uncharacterized protein (DUF1810 family)